MDRTKKKFAKIYNKNIDKIYRFIFLKVSSQEKAEDITSQVFLKGWNTFQNKEIKNPTAFLYQIARNSIVDFYRERDKFQTVSTEDFQIPDSSQSLEEKVTHNSDIQLVKKSLGNIKGEYQDLIIWHYIDDLSIKEISKILGKQEGTVRVSLYRAIRSLKKDIRKRNIQEA